MPRLDGTGPQGQGPMTGRGMGNCKGAGSGMGRGFGGGFCRFCPRFTANKELTAEEKKQILLEEKEAIEKELADLDK